MAHFTSVEKHLAAVEELTASKASLSTLTAELEKLRTDSSVEITQLKADLATAKTSMTSFEVKVKTLEATINNPTGEIETRANLKALEIVAAQGVPPVPPEATPPTPLATSGNDNLTGLERVKAAFVKQAEKLLGRKLNN